MFLYQQSIRKYPPTYGTPSNFSPGLKTLPFQRSIINHLEPGIARCIPFNYNTNNLEVHPPWMTGTTVTKSPSCKSCSSAFKTEESTPFMTIRKSLRITLASELEAALLTNETISFIDAGCFLYFKEEQPIIFLQFPRKFMVIKR